MKKSFSARIRQDRSTVPDMTRHLIGLPGFLHRLPLVPPDGADPDEYAAFVQSELGIGDPTAVGVLIQGHKVSLSLNPGALMWWYMTSEPEHPANEADTAWPMPAA
jgi:hypothetical protein